MLGPHSTFPARFINSLPGACTPAPAEFDESQQVAQARRGDAIAYGSLVRRYQDRLCNSLMHICGSTADAQDAAQEAFLKAFVNLQSFNGKCAFYTWLYRIAINAAISNHKRRRWPTPSEEVESGCSLELPDPGERSDERLLRQERATLVQQALATLNDEHRTILVLREIEDCDYDQIAQIMNIPVGTVRSRLHRARLQLRNRLEIVMAEASRA